MISRKSRFSLLFPPFLHSKAHLGAGLLCLTLACLTSTAAKASSGNQVRLHRQTGGNVATVGSIPYAGYLRGTRNAVAIETLGKGWNALHTRRREVGSKANSSFLNRLSKLQRDLNAMANTLRRTGREKTISLSSLGSVNSLLERLNDFGFRNEKMSSLDALTQEFNKLNYWVKLGVDKYKKWDAQRLLMIEKISTSGERHVGADAVETWRKERNRLVKELAALKIRLQGYSQRLGEIRFQAGGPPP